MDKLNNLPLKLLFRSQINQILKTYFNNLA